MTGTLGTPVVDAIEELVATTPTVAEVTFARVPARAPLLQERQAIVGEAAEIVDRALALREQTALPFWDSVILSSFGAAESVRTLLGSALHHHSQRESLFRLKRTECTATAIRTLAAEVPNGETLALLSCVGLSPEGRAHLPMLDFHLPYEPRNDQIALDAIDALAPGPGYLIRSGKSYHFLGTRPLDSDANAAFLYRALLIGPIVDRSWIAHQLLEGRSALRVSQRPGKDDEPTVVAIYPEPG